ncbi:MAG: type IV pilus assembly protein PilM [Planctomycetes bacterium]|nr:type IV pilus assembly protein PilM [Planctomycetota bacterium]
MAFRSVWCVDVGNSSLKAMHLRRDKGSVEILAVDKVDYTAGSEGFEPDQAKEALSIFHSRNEVRDPVVVIHPGQGTFMRFIKIPAFDDKKIQEMVGYEAQQQIPFPLDEVIWDCHVIDRDYMTGEERDVGLFAVRREAVEDYLEEFAGEELNAEMLVVGYLALMNFVGYDVDTQEPTIILDLGASHTDLVLVDHERFWIRQIPHRAEDITQALMARFKLGFAEAERLKQQMAKNPQQAAKIFQAVIQPHLRDLVQEIQRSIGYYSSQTGETKFEQAVLFGNGAKLLGITKYLKEHLGMPVTRAQSINRVRLDRDVNVKLLQTNLPAFALAAGGGLQALGVGVCNVDLIPGEEKAKKLIDRKKKHVFFAAAIVLVCIFVSFLAIQKKSLKSRSIVSHATDELADPKRRSKNVGAIDDESAEIYKNGDLILKVAEMRNHGLDSIRLLASVFSHLPNAEGVSATIKADDEDAVEGLRQEVIDGLSKKLWVPFAEMKEVRYPEDQGGGRRRRTGDKKKKDDGKVPAWKFVAFPMIKAMDDQRQSNSNLRTRFLTPLEKGLARERVLRRHSENKRGEEEFEEKFTYAAKVELEPGLGPAATIYVDPGRADGDGVMNVDLHQEPGAASVGTGNEEKARPQDGAPYFGARATWYIVPQKPKGDEDDEYEDEEGGDDDDE